MCTISSSLLEAFSLYIVHCLGPRRHKPSNYGWAGRGGMFIYVDKIQELGQQPGQTPYVRERGGTPYVRGAQEGSFKLPALPLPPIIRIITVFQKIQNWKRTLCGFSAKTIRTNFECQLLTALVFQCPVSCSQNSKDIKKQRCLTKYSNQVT